LIVRDNKLNLSLYEYLCLKKLKNMWDFIYSPT
jgi:hypothetical protein